VPQPTLVPFSVSASDEAVPVPASTGSNAPQITIPLPSTAQVVNEMDLSGAGADIPDGTTVDLSVTNEGVDGIPAPSSAKRTVEALRTIQSGAAKVVIEIIGVEFSQTVSLGSRPTFVLTFPSGFLLPNANYYLEYYDTSQPALGWQDPFEGPATISGNSLLFVDHGNPIRFVAHVLYFFACYAVSIRATPTPFPAPSPSATPTARPTATPTAGALSVTPSSFAFDAPGQTETLVASESGYAGTFSAVVNNPNEGTVVASAPGVFVVTSSANPGQSSVTVSDQRGHTVNVPFTVTITTGTISSKHG
jgi:hypothetical protein